MKSITAITFLILSMNCAFATGVKEKELKRGPASERGEYFCEKNPKKCKQIIYPTVSFGSDVKYRIAHTENVHGVLTSVCIAAGYKSYASGRVEYVDKDKVRGELFFYHGYNGSETGAFVTADLTNEIVSKIVCSPE